MPKSKIIIHQIFRILPFIVVVFVSTPLVGIAYIEATKLLGLRTIPVQVVGTGSMYPSLFWTTAEGGPEDESKTVVEEYRTTPHLYRLFPGFIFAGHTFLRRVIGYGDIVSFKNDKTSEILKANSQNTTSGFIKRVIGLPGDTLELRDGFVYRNGLLIEEPYLSSPRSTYGGTSLKDCVLVTVPEKSYFVLGDNRKVSSDSRFELGYVHEGDIQYILPYSEQKIYQSLWRDTSHDRELLGSPTLITSEFIGLVNNQRNINSVKKLTLKSPLINSAQLRGEKLLLDDKTGYSLKQAVESAGYTNIVLGEFVSYGHFTAKELLENLVFNPATAKQIMNQDYSDIGISQVSREINGCPTQIIVGHLGGYIPASYDQATVSNWVALRDNLQVVLPSWEAAVGYDNINQEKLALLLTIFRRRLSLAKEIIGTMEKNAWLTRDQEQKIKSDDADVRAAEALTQELNKE
jgi:signal peptidase I